MNESSTRATSRGAESKDTTKAARPGTSGGGWNGGSTPTALNTTECVDTAAEKAVETTTVESTEPSDETTSRGTGGTHRASAGTGGTQAGRSPDGQTTVRKHSEVAPFLPARCQRGIKRGGTVPSR